MDQTASGIAGSILDEGEQTVADHLFFTSSRNALEFVESMAGAVYTGLQNYSCI
jgi:hypothetical protein